MALTLDRRTDLEILRLTGSTIEQHDDHLVVRSPHTPRFHWGNFVVVLDEDATDDVAHWLEVFGTAFPDAGHVAIGLPRVPRGSGWSDAGVEISTDESLVADRLPEQRPLAPGYVARTLDRPEDWQRLRQLDLDENARTGAHPPAEHEVFTAGQVATRTRLVAEGHAAWFGAFTEDGELVSSLGVVRCGTLARYQSVGTDDRHRRRGLAGHLLGLAASWTADRGCDTWVIVTGTTNPAGRLYRSVGFVPGEESVSAYRPSR
jgi:GNAT superfamily N-acetyltransferase